MTLALLAVGLVGFAAVGSPGFAGAGLPAHKAGRPALTVFAGGDIQFAGEPGKMVAEHGPSYTFDRLRPLLDRADLRLANLECNLSDIGTPLAEKPYTFRTDPAALAALQGNFDALSFANNHSLDYGVDAFLDTIARAAEAGLPLSGAGRDRAAALRPVTIEVRGLRVALLSYTTLFAVPVRWGPLWVPTANKPGVALADADVVLPAVAAAKQDADLVIVFLHWGIEYQGVIPDQTHLARAMVDAGADLVIGCHPHIAQTLEVYRGRLIAYSLGNFAMEPGRPAASQSLAIEARLAADGTLVSADVIPLHYEAGRPRPATADEAKTVFGAIAPGIKGAAVTKTDLALVLAPR